MSFELLQQVFLTEDLKLINEAGEEIADVSKQLTEMSFQHAALGSDNARINAKGAGHWKFAVGDLGNAASIPANHGFRHFVTLGKSDPAFAADVAAAGISKKTVKGDTALHIDTVTHDKHAPLARVLDKWADHMEAHGGDAVHAAKHRYDAAAVRHSFGTGSEADAALVNKGRPAAHGGSGTNAVQGMFGSDEFGVGGAAKAAEPAPAPEGEKKKPKKNVFVKEAAAPATTAQLTESCKAVWRLAESKKAAPAAKVEEAVKKDEPAAAKPEAAPAK